MKISDYASNRKQKRLLHWQLGSGPANRWQGAAGAGGYMDSWARGSHYLVNLMHINLISFFPNIIKSYQITLNESALNMELDGI